MAMNMNDVKETSTTNDTRVIPLNDKWAIRTTKDDGAYLVTVNGTAWRPGDDEPCDELILKQYVQMYDVLSALDKAAGGARTIAQLVDALKAAADYMDNRSK